GGFETTESPSASGQVRRPLSSKKKKKIDHPENTCPPIRVGLGGNHQESFVGVSRLFVLFTARARLAQVENIIRLVCVHAHGPAQSGNRERQTVLIKVDHCQSEYGQRFVFVERERCFELFN